MAKIVPPTEFRSSIGLIEDYHQAKLPPLAVDLRSRFITFQRRGTDSLGAELLAVTSKNRLIHFDRNPTSGSGWNQREFDVDGAPFGKEIAKLIGFYQNGMGYALAFYATDDEGQFEARGMQRGDDGHWRHMPLSAELENAFGRIRQADTLELDDGRQIIYAVSTNFAPEAFVMAVLDPTTSEWNLAFQTELPNPKASFALLPGVGDDEITVATFYDTAMECRGGSIRSGFFDWGTKLPIIADLGIEVSAQQVYPIAEGSLAQGFFLLTEHSELLRVLGIVEGQPTIERFTGIRKALQGASHISVGVDADARIALFAIDANDSRLWLLREKKVAVKAAVTDFEPWVPLGNVVSAIACPIKMATGPELFLYDLDAQVQHMTQEPVQGCWFSQILKSPTQIKDTPEAISSYSLQVSPLAEGQIPIPGQVVEITADRLSSVTINGLIYPVDANTPLRVKTDSSGRLSLASIATGLSSPNLCLKAMGSQGVLFSKHFRADEDAHARLAGKDPTFHVTGEALKIHGFVPEDTPTHEADAAAKTLKEVAGAAVDFASLARGEKPSSRTPAVITRFHFQDGHFRSQPLSEAVWNELSTQTGIDDLDFSLSDIFGDIANFLKNALHWLVDVVVKIENAIVEVVLTIGGAIKKFVLDSIDKMADFLELFFAKLAEALRAVGETIRKAIDWLRVLFGWEDILLTKAVLSSLCLKTLDFMKDSVDERLPAFLKKEFTGWRSQVELAFDEAEKKIGKDLNFNDLVPSSSQPFAAGGPPLLAVAGQKAQLANQTRCDYVRGHVMNASTNGTGALHSALGTIEGEGLFDDFLEIFNASFPTEELARSAERIRGMVEQIKDATTFIEVALVAILEAIKDLVLLVLAAIEALILAFCKLAGAAIDGLKAILDGKIEIPVLSGLYKAIAHHDLTLLDLFALLIATPTTILYKLFYGGPELKAPFTKELVVEIENTVLPWPDLFGANRPAPEGALTEVPQWIKTTLKPVLVLSSAVYMALDIGLDITAAAENSGAPPDTSKAMTIASALSILSGVFIQFAGAPWSLWIEKPKDQWNEADRWSMANWSVLFAPILSDTAFLIFSKNHALQRFYGKVGPWISCVEGVVVFVTGVGAAVEMAKPNSGYNGYNQAAALLPSFPYMAQPIVLCGLDPGPRGWAIGAAIVIIDGVGDLGSAIAAVKA